MGVTIPLLTEQAYERVRGDIVNCTIAPGCEISEGQLCSDYGLSAAGVRAALTRLAHEGLVRPVALRGYRVLPVTLQDIQDLYDLRLMLEPRAARMAAGKVNTRELEAFEDICREGYVRGDVKSTTRFLESNKAFHVAIAKGSGNARLAMAIEGLLEDMTRLLHLGLGLRKGPPQLPHAHRSLIRALARADGETAERISREEIDASRSMVLAAVLTSRSSISLPITADGA